MVIITTKLMIHNHHLDSTFIKGTIILNKMGVELQTIMTMIIVGIMATSITINKASISRMVDIIITIKRAAINTIIMVLILKVEDTLTKRKMVKRRMKMIMDMAMSKYLSRWEIAAREDGKERRNNIERLENVCVCWRKKNNF